MELVGRRRELEALDQLVEAVRGGESRALVVTGEPGIGKTALLDYIAGSGSGCRVVRAAGVQSEMELAFAGLHQLCTPMLDRLDRLPPPQAEALRVAFGVVAGLAPDRFFVGLAVLNLLSDLAEEQPLICLIDDAQWMDRASAQVFAFVARRLGAESVGLILSARVPEPESATIPSLTIRGLHDADARALLDAVVLWPLDAHVRDQIVAETRGNPLGLMELARALLPGTVAGGFQVPTAAPLANTIEATFEQQIQALPADARRLIQLAAADPVGDPVVLWKAAEQLGIPADAATQATEAGLVDFGARVRCRHPLVRSAAYRSASLRERHDLHRALADAIDPASDPDRCAWHRAEASPVPDEYVAAALEQSARRALDRGGLAAAAAFLERAAILTPELETRARRFLASASAKRAAGALDDALTLLVEAEDGPLDARSAAEAERLHGRIALDQGRFPDAVGSLLDAARRLDPIDAAESRETYFEGLQAARRVYGPDERGGMLIAAEAAQAAPAPPQPPRLVDLLLDAWATRLTEGFTPAAPAFTKALERLRTLSFTEATHASLVAETGNSAAVALEMWDDEAWHSLMARHVQLARERGATVHLQFALNAEASTHIFAGELHAAEGLLEEDRLIAEATGNPPMPWTEPCLAAWRGREDEASRLIGALTQLAAQPGFSPLIMVSQFASSILYNGLGRYDAACDSAQPLFEREYGSMPFAAFELAEAGSRTGDDRLVLITLDWMSERASATGTEWALGTEALISALRHEGATAEQHYRDAIARLRRTRMRAYLARTHLLYGEWLRRERRRIDAREQLRTAFEMLTAMGFEAFAERARRELVATGVTVSKRTVETSRALTAQEAHIARLARDGLSNPEIGTRLFISPRTVKYHLSKVYTKLNITSRERLDRVLPPGEATAAGSR